MSTTQTLTRLTVIDQTRAVLPGLMLCSVIALAATFVADHHGGPQFLYALLIGIAFHFLADSEKCAPGIELAAKANVNGNVYYKLIEMAMGSSVNGSLVHRSETESSVVNFGRELAENGKATD